MLFLPNFFIAVITTIGTRNIKTLVIHPHLVLLPVFTFFSFQKKELGFCSKGDGDSRIQFSPLMTKINMVVSLVCCVPFFGFYDYSGLEICPNCIAIPISLSLSLILTIAFLYMEKCCCDCLMEVRCCNIKMDSKIFDPHQ